MDNELNRKAAELLGWEWDGWLSYYRRPPVDGIGHMFGSQWHPTSDLNQAALLEAEVERRGLQEAYANLLVEHHPDSDVFHDTRLWFWLATAPAEARVRAAVECLEVESNRPQGRSE